jgi:uncharacterized protein YbjT (DUF2867 family)
MLGSVLVPMLADAGHEVVVASRRQAPEGVDPRASTRRIDLATGEGLEAALAGIEVVVHAAGNVRYKSVDVAGTARLTRAMKELGTGRLVYTSIVGVDRHPFPYYRAKFATEQAIEQSGVPATIVRITQFHDLIDMFLRSFARSPLMPIPAGFVTQPVDRREAAAEIVRWTGEDAAGRVDDVGGPEVRKFTDLAGSWLAATGKRRVRVPVPLPGKTARAFREGVHTCPDRAVGVVTWEEHLSRKYG